MSIATPPTPPKFMTVEEFLRLPEDGISRELIRGELKERGMTVRNRFHSRLEAKFVHELMKWLDTRPEPRGEIVCGEAGFRLRGTRDSLVGIDVAYVPPELLAATGECQKIFDGPPRLAVEIWSPSDTLEAIEEKVELYLEAGAVVWEIDSKFRNVRVHQPGQEMATFTASQVLSGEPYLPGFRVAVADLFR